MAVILNTEQISFHYSYVQVFMWLKWTTYCLHSSCLFVDLDWLDTSELFSSLFEIVSTDCNHKQKMRWSVQICHYHIISTHIIWGSWNTNLNFVAVLQVRCAYLSYYTIRTVFWWNTICFCVIQLMYWWILVGTILSIYPSVFAFISPIVFRIGKVDEVILFLGRIKFAYRMFCSCLGKENVVIGGIIVTIRLRTSTL